MSNRFVAVYVEKILNKNTPLKCTSGNVFRFRTRDFVEFVSVWCCIYSSDNGRVDAVFTVRMCM